MTTLLDTVKEWISGDWGDEDESSETPNPVYCIRGADIVPVINTDYSGIPKRFVSDRTKRNKLLKVGDIIVEKSGGSPTQSTGRTVYISSELVASKQGDIVCSNFCEAFRAKENWDSLYLYYYLQLVYNSGVFFNFEGKTSGLKNLDVKGAFAAIKMPRIDVGDQGKIANVINIIESKIALNHKKIEKLEALAKTIYDYWFVQFDFPDANGRPYKSSGGKMVYNTILKREIPDGWEVGNLCEIADVYNGATPSTENAECYNGSIVWVTPKDLSDQHKKFTWSGERYISKVGYDSCSTHMLPPGSILMTSRAPIGLMSIAAVQLCTNQGFKSIVARNMSMSFYLYYYIESHMTQIEQLGSGTTFKEVSRGSMCNFPVLLSTNNGINQNWEGMVRSIFERQKKLLLELDDLTSLRDFLLPLLMNGQVEVGE